jgi:hypothetical protein
MSVIERRECGRCGAEVREGKMRHFCGEPYPFKAATDIRVVRYVPETPARAEGLTSVLLCDACMAGEGGECHTPGCALWLNRAPDIPVEGAQTGETQAERDAEAKALGFVAAKDEVTQAERRGYCKGWDAAVSHSKTIREAVDDLRWVANGLADVNSGRRRNMGITRNCESKLREIIAGLEKQRPGEMSE